MNMTLSQYASHLIKGDWSYVMSDDYLVRRNGDKWVQDSQNIAQLLGKPGLRLFDLFRTYFTNFSSTPTGEEWRLVGAILYVNGIHETENTLKNFVQGAYIQWGKLAVAYPNVDFRTW